MQSTIKDISSLTASMRETRCMKKNFETKNKFIMHTEITNKTITFFVYQQMSG